MVRVAGAVQAIVAPPGTPHPFTTNGRYKPGALTSSPRMAAMSRPIAATCVRSLRPAPQPLTHSPRVAAISPGITAIPGDSPLPDARPGPSGHPSPLHSPQMAAMSLNTSP